MNLKQAATYLFYHQFLALAPVPSQLELQSLHAKTIMKLNEQVRFSYRNN